MKGYRFIDPDWEPIRRILIIFGWIITIALIILVIRIIPEMIATNYYKSSRQETHSSNEQGAKKETDVSEDEDVVISVSEPSNSPHYVVSHVRDGDTIEVLYNGTSEQAIRMIGVDTPETVHPDIDVECYGPEASAYTKNRLEGKEVGIELFVMDDGWFGERNDDSSSLGDWYPNKKKLPNGLKGIADKINNLGMSFGIWVEPEMVNENSNLYRKHPEWVMQIPGKPHSEGRNQRVLDLGRKDVQDFIIDTMSKVFRSANIEYVKWDMNRNLSDAYSSVLPPSRQGEVIHRYLIGLYRCMRVLTKRFPHILFEGCASGGNRFDLGILSYFPQIWASDDTDAIVRAEIQTGYSYGYPQSSWGSHVSGVPNHQTLRITPLESRFAVAGFGSLGYECNLCDMSREGLAEIQGQIEIYKKYRKVFQYGQMYRGRTFTGGDSGGNSVLVSDDSNVTEWTVVSPDKKMAVGMIVQKLMIPNMAYQYYRATGLDEDKYYHFYNKEHKVDIKQFGDLVNIVSPIHLKPGSIRHNLVSKFYKLEGDRENLKMFGGSIMNAGVKLLPSYAGTGFNGNTRIFSDFNARVYFMEEEDIS